MSGYRRNHLTGSFFLLLSLSLARSSVAQPVVYTFPVSPPRSIPDGLASGISESQTLANAPSSIADLNVSLTISGDFNGDLFVTLAHESGFVVLLNRVGRRAADPFGYDDPGLNVTFDDSAGSGDIHVYRLALSGNHNDFLTQPLTGAWAPDARNVDPAQVLDTSGRTAFLSSFNGLNANGTWTLFLADLSGGGTSRLESWGLEITAPVNTAPTLSDIADQSTNEDAALNVALTVGDAETPPGNLSVTVSSSNPTLLPNSNISLGGSGANRILGLTPEANQSGSATLTVTVSDGVNSTSDSFLFTVSAVNDPPTLSDMLDLSVQQDAAVPAIGFVLSDPETPSEGLVISVSSSNPQLVPSENVIPQGAGSNRTVIIRPLTNQWGSATITISVSDGALSASDTFVLTVQPIKPSVAVDPMSLSTAEGSDVAFKATTAGSAPLSFQWSFNNSTVAEGTNSVLALSQVKVSQSGQYSVVVSNAAGSVNSAPAELEVRSLEPVRFQAAISLPAEGFRFMISGVVGQQVIVQSSIDLKNWQSISTNRLESPSAEFQDPESTNQQLRFYRAVVQ